MNREQLLSREEEAWNGFMSQVSRVPADCLEENGAVEGWSVKDLVWHCAYWARFCAETLEGLESADLADPFEGHDDAYWDAVNGQVAQEAKSMSWEQITAEAPSIRERVRGVFASAPLGGKPDTWFAEETFEHYDEHAEHVRRFVDG